MTSSYTDQEKLDAAWETALVWCDMFEKGRDPHWVHWALGQMLGIACPLPGDVVARLGAA